MQIIPVTNDADQRFNVILNNQVVQLHIRWQDIGHGWFMDLLLDQVTMVTGTRLNSAALAMGSVLTDFVGDILPLPITQPATELERESWGNTHRLIYLTPDEISDNGVPF